MATRGRRPRIFGVEAPSSIDEDSFNNLSAGSRIVSGGGLGTGADSVRSRSAVPVGVIGECRTNMDALFDAALAASSFLSSRVLGDAATSNLVVAKGKSNNNSNKGPAAAAVNTTIRDDVEEGEETADIRALMTVMEEGVSGSGGVRALEWDWITHEEATAKAAKMYREAAHAQVIIRSVEHKMRDNLLAIWKL